MQSAYVHARRCAASKRILAAPKQALRRNAVAWGSKCVMAQTPTEVYGVYRVQPRNRVTNPPDCLIGWLASSRPGKPNQTSSTHHSRCGSCQWGLQLRSPCLQHAPKAAHHEPTHGGWSCVLLRCRRCKQCRPGRVRVMREPTSQLPAIQQQHRPALRQHKKAGRHAIVKHDETRTTWQTHPSALVIRGAMRQSAIRRGDHCTPNGDCIEYQQGPLF